MADARFSHDQNEESHNINLLGLGESVHGPVRGALNVSVVNRSLAEGGRQLHTSGPAYESPHTPGLRRAPDLQESEV